ncbi:hypothetical protein [uncultured Microbulbifer sp.]|uniref:hypothetical protein n=1 Tax=uncultured Microbulbifer sp. TaxID=348147 RepID=UPI00260A0BE8|nr:hypothetical protein [uncultured Microbulbifer sp.]
MRLQIAILAPVILMFSGCASFEAISAGQIGCVPEAIAISEKKRGWISTTWIATCNNKRHICSSFQAGEKTRQVNCTAEQE